ncbi:MAG: helix-turn-helix domain-containing protein [Chitinophagaceae bacterium]|nr:MAG: helix-turn-helix domain-containing protein [Chitinophagaceae bacterium]
MKLIPVRRLNKLQHHLPDAGQFKIRRIEDILQGNDLLHDLHRHDFFFILSIQHGEGNHEIDFAGYTIADQSIFFLRPGQVHQLTLKAGSAGFLLEFNAAFYQPKDQAASQRLRRASNRPYCQPASDRFSRLHNILASVFSEYSLGEEGYIDIIKSSLEIFVIEYARQSAHPGINVATAHNYTQERFEEFLELLEKHVTRHKQVSNYTDLMSLSPYQLNEITKSSVGKTASELISEYILLEAKRYLLATPSQVKEIADLLGYDDPSYFIRFFKKQTGLSPEAFRQSLK